MNGKRCPLCGSEHEPQGWEVSTFRDYHQTAFGEAVPPTEFKEWRRSSPVRAPSLQADVWVPAAIAAISGLLAFAFTIPFIFAWSLPWWSPFISGLVVLAVIWGILQGAGRKLLFASEVVIGHDLNRDGTVGKPMFSLEVKKIDERGHAQYLYPDMPTSTDKFKLLAQSALSGRPLSQAEWTGGGRPFSRTEFEGVMAEMDKLGWVKWKDESARAQGRELTPEGKHALRDLLLKATEVK